MSKQIQVQVTRRPRPAPEPADPPTTDAKLARKWGLS